MPPTHRTNSPFNWLPKLDVPSYDVLRAFELMKPGQDERLRLPGLQPSAVVPEPGEDQSLRWGKLKFLVVIDPLKTETARFWEDHGEFDPSKPEDIKTDGVRAAIDVLRGG